MRTHSLLPSIVGVWKLCSINNLTSHMVLISWFCFSVFSLGVDYIVIVPTLYIFHDNIYLTTARECLFPI